MSEEKKSVWSQIKGFVDKSVNVSKKGLKNAGEAITNFGDKSVLKIETNQLKSKLEKNYITLGQIAEVSYNSRTGIKISPSNQDVKDLVALIASLKKDILRHEKAMETGLPLEQVELTSEDENIETVESVKIKAKAKGSTAASRKNSSTRTLVKKQNGTASQSSEKSSSRKTPVKSVKSEKASAKTTKKASQKK